MDVTALPFNALIGLTPADPPLLVRLPTEPQHGNHLGTVHASVLVAVAEAGSGVWLVRAMGDVAGVVPVVRRLEAKFRRPATGPVAARIGVEPPDAAAVLGELASRGRALVTVPVEVVDDAGAVVLTAAVEWFLSRTPV